MSPTVFFQELLSTCSFEDLALRLTSRNQINRANELFPYAKPRILMASVMIYKFPEYHSMTGTMDVYKLARALCLSNTPTEQMYKDFRESFFVWIKKDKEVMLIELNKAQDELSKSADVDVEWADSEIWKEGVEAQVKLIEDSKTVLETSHANLFGTSPK